MCGIFGIAEFGSDLRSPVGGPELASLLAPMGQALSHRGPDDQGVTMWCNPRLSAGIGMRRLSIIDLQGGRQPMASEDGSVTAVCNGELYNYRELSRELTAKGHRFRTRSDSEVLVHLYEEEGWTCVSRLRGMFAFALWDAPRQMLVLGRDRLGIKPLFYRADYRADFGRVVFGSEVRAVLTAGQALPEFHREALLMLLMLQYVPAPDSAFTGIRKLLPGSVLLVTERGADLRRYWSPPGEPGNGAEAGKPFRQAAREVRARLEEAVTSHLVSDVPVGAFLSGGLDSSAIVALMSRAVPGSFHTFSVGFEGPARFSELPYARLVAERFDTRHHELVVTPQDVVGALPRLVGHLDEPLADPAVVPTYLLSALAARSVKVVLTGEGADELFGGYRRYWWDRLAAWYRWVPPAWRRSLSRWLGSGPAHRRLAQGARALSHDSPARRHLDWVGVFTQEELAEILAESADLAPLVRGLERVFRGYFDSSGSRESALADMLRADQSTWLPDDLLTKIDRMTMASSLEARVPYLDHPLVELVARLPARMKIRGAVRKAILREAVRDLVPPEILGRRKMGFAMPLAAWMRGPLRDFVGDHLGRPGPPGLLNRKVVERYRDEHFSGRQDRSLQLWSLVVMTLWHQAIVLEPLPLPCRA